MRILVTGGLGFIGSHVTQAAIDAGHDVTVLDNRSLHEAARQPDCSDLPEVFAPGTVNLVQADVRDQAVVAAELTGIDAVVHLAAKVGLGDGVSDAADYVSHNDLGTATLVAALAGTDIDRLVLASSMVVYGEGLAPCAEHGLVPPAARSLEQLADGDFEARCPTCGDTLGHHLVAEESPLEPANVYAASKVAQEYLGKIWARTTGGAAVALRFHNVYGRRLPRDTPYAGVAALFVSMLNNGHAPTVYEDGGQRRDFVHVRDVARAVIAAAVAPVPGSSMPAYNIGSGQPRTVLQMATALSTATGGAAPVVTGQFRLGDVRHITASNHRAISELNWRPEEDFAMGMAEISHLGA
ncbi:MAG: NAD-dependent epimerase/dehydratase family protein [Candidatus Nanopelagicales bacterium]